MSCRASLSATLAAATFLCLGSAHAQNNPVEIFQTLVNHSIVTNGHGAITGSVLNNVLNTEVPIWLSQGSWDENGVFTPNLPFAGIPKGPVGGGSMIPAIACTDYLSPACPPVLVSTAYPTYAALSAIIGTANQYSQVSSADVGTHIDPVSGGTVPNAGNYAYSVSPVGWSWLSSPANAFQVLSSAATSDGINFTATSPTGSITLGNLYYLVTPTGYTAGASPRLNVSGVGFRGVLDRQGLAMTALQLQPGTGYLLYANSSSFTVVTYDKAPFGFDQNLTHQLNLYNSSGVLGSTLGTSAVGELNISSMFGGTLTPLARFDNATGAFRAFNDIKIGATAGAALSVYSPFNLQPYVPADASATVMATTASDASSFESSPQQLPYQLSITTPYYLNAGDYNTKINVTASGAFVDAQFMTIGSTNQIDVTGGGSNSVTIYVGPGVTLRHTSATPNLPVGIYPTGTSQVTFGPQAEIRVHRYSQNDYSIEAFDSTVATGSSTAIASARPYALVSGGQSLAVKLITEGGLAGLQQQLQTLGDYSGPWIVQGAVGSSACLQAAGTGGNWWVNSDNSPGPDAIALDAAVTASIAAGQPAPSAMLWNQGQQESGSIAATGSVTYVTYKACLQTIFAYFRSRSWASSTFPIIITPLGADDTSNDAGDTAVREAQLAVIATSAANFEGGETYNLTRRSPDIHLNLAGERAEGIIQANVVDNVLNSHNNDIGPTFVVGSFAAISSTSFQISLKAFSSTTGTNSLSNSSNPISVLGFSLYPPGDATSVSPCPISNITRSFTGGVHVFTMTTASACTGARFVYPQGSLSLGRTGRFLFNTSTGLVPRAYSSSPP